MGAKRFFSVFLTATWLSSSSASSSVVEHWACDEKYGTKEWTQEWTIVENRMFAPKGKGSIPVIMNTPQVAVAYMDYDGPRLGGIVTIYVLDKIAGKMVTYDNSDDVILKRAYGKIDPKIGTEPCRRLD
jgi:hypothetical protein